VTAKAPCISPDVYLVMGMATFLSISLSLSALIATEMEGTSRAIRSARDIVLSVKVGAGR